MKKFFSICLVVLLPVLTIYLGGREYTTETGSEGLFSTKENLVLWYTDEAITDYLGSVALDYYEEYDVRVTPVLVSGLEYLEKVNQASVKEEAAPDLFIVSNDSLEKAYLAGLATEISDLNGEIVSANYPQTALDAVSYQDKIIGYPFYYETAVLLYNHSYMADAAKAVIEMQADAGMEEGLNEENINATMLGMIPATIDDILSFAEVYDAPESVEAVFKWDVSDIFYNYFFVGNYLNTGGAAGDDKTQVNVYNQETIECLNVYQSLNQFFSIDTKAVTYDSVLQDFVDGKIVFTVATTDAIARVEEAKKAGEFQYDYGIATLPDVSDSLQSKGLSVTQTVVINGYSKQKELANAFAGELALSCGENLYARTGKIASRKGIVYENEKIAETMKEYEQSVPLCKMMEISNFWVELEICFANVWKGSDADETLRQLSEQVLRQISGE